MEGTEASFEVGGHHFSIVTAKSDGNTKKGAKLEQVLYVDEVEVAVRWLELNHPHTLSLVALRAIHSHACLLWCRPGGGSYSVCFLLNLHHVEKEAATVAHLTW